MRNAESIESLLLIVLERFNTTAGNPVKKILLKLNLSDHRLFKDGGGVSAWHVLNVQGEHKKLSGLLQHAETLLGMEIDFTMDFFTKLQENHLDMNQFGSMLTDYL
ncbi:hypothetical protein Tco_1123686 [Tanacetum coccineum]|uniref:Uncharacterized protein n=1 Tax=Tanacetum coccineum TaxID=301880 RepID=A0ABQ5J410_9ASTR